MGKFVGGIGNSVHTGCEFDHEIRALKIDIYQFFSLRNIQYIYLLTTYLKNININHYGTTISDHFPNW